jgi:predicted nucleotide-binding protein
VTDNEDWISAAEALALLKPAMGSYAAVRAIATRAHDGVVHSRAARFVAGQRVQDNTEVPPSFWWARGEDALHQNWTAGDFDTWIDHKFHWRAYGVQFLRSDVESMIPKAVVDNTDRPKKSARQDASKVFVVHGHDEAALHSVARFLEQLNLKPIVLREQPDRGRATIEKFEEYAGQVGFAVVLLTPDDLAGSPATSAQSARARQNVIFELGYFAGSLGRGRACLLRKGDVEIPSDLYGVIYTDMDASDGWKLKLVKELRAADLPVDISKITT